MTVALSVLLAGCLATAAIAKMRDRGGFVATLRRLGAPAALSWVLPAVELALAGALVAGGARTAAAIALALLGVFTLALRRLGTVPCRCFGAGADGDPRLGQVRNAMLGLVAAALVIWPADAVWDAPVRDLAGAGTVAAGLTCVWLLARPREMMA